jgi:predicted transcriptional regulator
MKITSVALPADLTQRIDAVAKDADRSRSWVIRTLLERSMTGADRLRAFEEIASAGLEEYAANGTREKAPNATAVIAESCVEGRRRLAALDEIAKGGE